MRKALNENPIVQIAALGALGLLMAALFMSRMGGGGGSSSAPDPAAESPAASTTGGTLTPSNAADALAPESAPAAPVGSSPPFEAGKGLPEDFVDAYRSGDAVVLLVMQERGLEDKPLAAEVERLRSRPDTSVFTIDAKNIARYSRVAEGVSLNRVPAIIVLDPLEGKLARGEAPPLPEATISYGYRGPESVGQTVRDALYEGKVSGFDPG